MKLPAFVSCGSPFTFFLWEEAVENELEADFCFYLVFLCPNLFSQSSRKLRTTPLVLANNLNKLKDLPTSLRVGDLRSWFCGLGPPSRHMSQRMWGDLWAIHKECFVCLRRLRCAGRGFWGKLMCIYLCALTDSFADPKCALGGLLLCLTSVQKGLKGCGVWWRRHCGL